MFLWAEYCFRSWFTMCVRPLGLQRVSRVCSHRSLQGFRCLGYFRVGLHGVAARKHPLSLSLSPSFCLSLSLSLTPSLLPPSPPPSLPPSLTHAHTLALSEPRFWVLGFPTASGLQCRMPPLVKGFRRMKTVVSSFLASQRRNRENLYGRIFLQYLTGNQSDFRSAAA